MSIEYWVTCARDPWEALASDDAFGDIVHTLREDGECTHDAVQLSLDEAAPSFVPAGSVVVHVAGPSGADWTEVLELLDAIAAAGEGVVFSEDRQIVLDRRTVKPGVQAVSESPAWAVALTAKHPSLEIVVFGTQHPRNPKDELKRVGLMALAKRVRDTGFWNGSRFGDVHCTSIPQGSFDPLASQAGVDPRKYIVAMHFTGRVTGAAWTDALVAAQILAHASRGRGFALGPDGSAHELPP